MLLIFSVNKACYRLLTVAVSTGQGCHRSDNGQEKKIKIRGFLRQENGLFENLILLMAVRNIGSHCDLNLMRKEKNDSVLMNE